MGIRIAGYYIELPFSVYDCLSSMLLAVLWFVGIFGFRMGITYLELLPQLGTLAANYQLSPRMEFLTWHPLSTSLAAAAVLGPLTHSVLAKAAVLTMLRQEQDDVDLDEPGDELDAERYNVS